MKRKRFKGFLFIYHAIILVALLTSCTQGTRINQLSPSVPLTSCLLSTAGVDIRKEAKCGSISVYEDRASQSGRKIRLHIAVLPAISRNPVADPLFFIAGGPGEAATESFLSISGAFQQINQKRDIVLVDQRGTGQSNPLQCPLDDEQSNGEYDPQKLQTQIQSCSVHLSEQADLRFYTTAIAMDDLDQVRQDLGYDKINLYGVSYGTRAALEYLRQHPDRVRAVILDGVAPPSWSLGTNSAANAQVALNSIMKRCNLQQGCLQAFPNLNQDFQALLGNLQRQPAKVSVVDPMNGGLHEISFTSEYFGNTIFSMSYTSETAALIPLLVHTAFVRNDYSLLAAQGLANTELALSHISQGMRFSVLCSEDVPFYGQPPNAGEGYLGESTVRSFQDICSVWPRGKIPTDFKEPVVSSVPTMTISGQDDPVTPPQNAELAAQTLINHVNLVIPGQGHVNIFRGCIPNLANSFLEKGSLENLDTTCSQNIEPLPFFVNFSGPNP